MCTYCTVMVCNVDLLYCKGMQCTHCTEGIQCVPTVLCKGIQCTYCTVRVCTIPTTRVYNVHTALRVYTVPTIL